MQYLHPHPPLVAESRPAASPLIDAAACAYLYTYINTYIGSYMFAHLTELSAAGDPAGLAPIDVMHESTVTMRTDPHEN
jgi:hypothetical protein